MTPRAYALFFTFLACSIVLGWLAARLAARFGGPTAKKAAILPFVAGFGAFYLIGHKLGIEIGPQVELFGFQVSLFGDLAIGFTAAMIAALIQTAVVSARGSARHRAR
jgi:hypothetical protein